MQKIIKQLISGCCICILRLHVWVPSMYQMHFHPLLCYSPNKKTLLLVRPPHMPWCPSIIWEHLVHRVPERKSLISLLNLVIYDLYHLLMHSGLTVFAWGLLLHDWDDPRKQNHPVPHTADTRMSTPSENSKSFFSSQTSSHWHRFPKPTFSSLNPIQGHLE